LSSVSSVKDEYTLTASSSSIPFITLVSKVKQLEKSTELLEINKLILKNNVSKLAPLNSYFKLLGLIIL